MGQMKLAIDAMGGDHAPEAIVEGCLSAVREWEDLEIVLVGDQEKVASLLPQVAERIKVLHTDEWITSEDEPVKSIRRKKRASMVICAELVKNKEVDGLVSAGNTGALMASGLLIIGRMKHIERPALATILPTFAGKGLLLLDVGANMDAAPEHLLDYAIMGNLYAKRVLHTREPKVGLLDVGTEETKGNQLTKQAFSLLQDSNYFHFIGNQESRDMLSGNVDVVVCDGFVGNVVLKFLEGVGSGVFAELKSIFYSNWLSKLGALAAKSGLKAFKQKFDYAEYGGAPMLGIDGVCIKAHGSSNGRAIHNAIGQAYQCVKGNVLEEIRELKIMGDEQRR
jgi:phosphate acyltransferase